METTETTKYKLQKDREKLLSYITINVDVQNDSQ